ncbi:MAG: C10 family peptidase, partial [Bacteroidales bacterium]|nr:C10 family peptidase [Bacteroidales bacterium]
MLKRFSTLFSFIIVAVLCMPLYAEVITTEVAKQTANTFLTLDDEWHGNTNASIKLVEHEGTPAYYVIEYSAGGWAIVSAQSSSSPIIGYNTEGAFAARGAMELLLDFNAQIISARARDNAKLEHKGWQRIRERKTAKEINQTPDVAPLIKINLDQSAPFNNYCPEIDGEKALVGCVAVGMTQAIMVQRYPQAPQGAYSYHCGSLGTLSIDYDKERPYDWDGMYSGNMDEIARLAYHCGISVEMGYGTTSSGTVTQFIETALVRNFGYDANRVRYVTKTNDIDAWLNTILGELVEGRAVVYRGQGGGGGHCWNVDGWKQATQMVHCNWGWNGIGNGYFDINNMTDSYQGVSFLGGHAAVIGVGAPTSTPYDVLLSNRQFVIGAEPGTALADVKVLCGDKNATYTYQLYCQKSGDSNTRSPYDIVDGKLITTETITYDNAFKHLGIKVTNTNNGKSYEKDFD